MRLRSSEARLTRILRRSVNSDDERELKTQELRDYWKQLKRDKELVYGPDPQGYKHTAPPPAKSR